MTVPAGARRQLVGLQNPGAALPDGDGGFTQAWTNLDPPSLYVQILPATAQQLERVTAGTVLSTASHIVTGPYHAGVNTKTRILFQPGTTVGIVSITQSAGPLIVTTLDPHGFGSGDMVRIVGHLGSTPAVDGVYRATVIDADTFTIPRSVSILGSGGTVGKLRVFSVQGVANVEERNIEMVMVCAEIVQ